LEQFDVVHPFGLDSWPEVVGFFLLIEFLASFHRDHVQELEELEEVLVAVGHVVLQRNHLPELKQHVHTFEEQHEVRDLLVLDLQLVLRALFLLQPSCFRLLDFGHLVRLSWPLHCRTPSLLLLGISLRKLFFASYVWQLVMLTTADIL
jgi:hypothetical protein